MALRGTLRDFSLGEILQLIGFQRKTGVLTIEGTEDTVTISFVDGMVVAADSLKRQLENRLGTLLVRARKLDPAALAGALDEGRRTRQRLGDVLLKKKLISSEDIREALRTQILNLIYRLFRWEDGRYYFSQESNVDYDRENFRPVPTENILMESARMIDEWPLIQKKITSLDMVFRKAEGTESLRLVSEEAPAKPAGALVVSPVEALLWDLVDGRKTVNEITESTFLSDFDVVKALDQMLGRHLIVEVPKFVPSPEIVPPPALAPRSERALAPSMALWVAVAALFAVSLWFMPRNPANVLLRMGERGGIQDSLRHAISVSRLQRVDRGVELYYLTSGRYPKRLDDVTSASILEGYDLHEGGFGDYRYILRVPDGKYDLYGKSPKGSVDPNLVLSRTLDPVSEENVPKSLRKKEKIVAKPEGIEVVN
jgi:uncharacterized protein DUF4388